MDNFIKSYEYNGFVFIHIGYETSVHMKYVSNDFRVDVMVPIDELISSMNQNKKGSFRINDVMIAGEKTKPSFMEFVIGNDTITINATGPDDKNKTKTSTVSIQKDEFIFMVKNSVKIYRDMVEFEAVGDSKVDSNKLRKKLEKLDKFLSKEF